MIPTIDEILARLPEIRDTTFGLSEILLANLLMIGEVPAPTFDEEERVRLMQDRFSMCGLQNCSTDEVGNGVGIIPGTESEKSILLVAHVDTVFDRSVDHTISVQPDHVSGPSVGDNSLGLAVLASLPTILDELELRFKSDLILMCASRSLGRGNLEGLTFFIENSKIPIRAGICVEGVRIGRLSYSSIGMLRGEINCAVPEEYDWTRFGAVGAIQSINEVINKINTIPLPRKPRTSIVLGSIEGGKSFNVIATYATLRFEIRSESSEMVAKIKQQLDNIAAEVSAQTNAEVEVSTFAERHPGGIPFSHPLAARAREVMESLEIEARSSPSTSEVSAFFDAGIPAITIGISKGKQYNKVDEMIEIEPIYTGVAQLIGLLMAIDNGYCDE